MFTPRNFKIKPKYSKELAAMIQDEIDPVLISLETDPNLTENHYLKLDFYGIDIKTLPLSGKLSLDSIDAIAELNFITKINIVNKS